MAVSMHCLNTKVFNNNLCWCSCEQCLVVMVERAQFVNNTATHGAAIDVNTTLPIPVIITQSMFDSNHANVLTKAQIAENVSLAHAGDGGALRCLGGEH